MRQPSFRIYATANLVIYLFFAIALFPEGLGIGIMAVLYSAFFSSPTLLLLWGCFALLKQYRTSATGNWILLLLAVGLCAFVPMTLLGIVVDGKFSIDTDFLLISAGAAYGGTLLQVIYIHKYFKSIYHETVPAIEAC